MVFRNGIGVDEEDPQTVKLICGRYVQGVMKGELWLDDANVETLVIS